MTLDEAIEDCKECDGWQVAEWLEELKELRKWKEQEEKACDRFYKQGRAEAINELENWLHKRILRTIPIEYDELVKVLEQLREKKE